MAHGGYARLGTVALALLVVFGTAALLLASLVSYPAMYDEFGVSHIAAWIRQAARWAPPAAYFSAGTIALGVAFAVSSKWAGTRIAIALPLATALALSGPLGAGYGTLLPTPIGGLIKVSTTATAPERPHILLIGIDSLRSDRFANPRKMPHTVALQDSPQSRILQDHHVGVPRTFPSWLEMIEGRYSAKTHVRHMFPDVRVRASLRPSFVRKLREAGYETHAVSDFAGDIFPRFRAGFEHIDAPDLNMATLIRMGMLQALPLFLPLFMSAAGRQIFPELREAPAFADPHPLAEAALAPFLKEDSRPQFVTCFFSTAHFPYAAPWPYYLSHSDPAYDGPFSFLKNPAYLDDGARISDADIAQVRALFDGSLTAIDAAVGHMVATLKQRGLWEHTIVLLTADHGEDLYEEGRAQGHGEHLRGRWVTRVPLLIRAPHLPQTASELSFVTRSIDLAPTVLGLVGLEYEQGDGIDLSPWLEGKRRRPPQLTAYSETGLWFAPKGSTFFQEKRLHYPGIARMLSVNPGETGDLVLNADYEDLVVTAKHRSLVEGRYKIIYMPTHEGPVYELYDRYQDPDNRHDLARAKPRQLARLKRKLEQTIAAIEADRRSWKGYVLKK